MADTREKIQDTRASRVQPIALFVLLLFSWAALADTPKPAIPKAVQGEQCVEPTDFMRRNHMDVLLHQRDETMHRGIRSKQHSLKGCLACHAVKDAAGQPVTAADPHHFCSQCHQYAAVKIDCFQCHASVPEANTGAADTALNGAYAAPIMTPGPQPRNQ